MRVANEALDFIFYSREKNVALVRTGQSLAAPVKKRKKKGVNRQEGREGRLKEEKEVE